MLAALEQCGEAGQAWLEELETSRDPWFNINVGDGFYHYHRSLERRPDDAVLGAPGYYAREGRRVARPRRPASCRPNAPARSTDYRELLSYRRGARGLRPDDRAAPGGFPYVEGHKFYCEHWYTNLFFNKIREFGALLARSGVLAEAEDVFHLTTTSSTRRSPTS